MSIFKLAYYNTSRRKTQTLLLGLSSIAIIMALVLFFTITRSLHKGLKLGEEKLGADLLVTSRESELSIEDFLFTGSPDSSYIDKKILDKLIGHKDIESITSQFYTATIEGADCCGPGQSLRMVGIDLDTDFILDSWFTEKKIDSLSPNEIVVGKKVPLMKGANIVLLGEIFTVVETLDRTGTGMDDSIFLDIDRARDISKNKFSQELWREKDPSKSISTILIKTKKGVDLDYLSSDIKKIEKNVKISSLSKSVSMLKNQINGFTRLLSYIAIVLLFISIISLVAQYRSFIYSRFKEIGYMKGLGLSRKDISKLFFYEVFFISVGFGAIGTGLGILCVNPSIKLLEKFMTITFDNLGIASMILSFFLATGFSFLLASLSSASPILKAYRLDALDLMEKGGLR